MQPSAKIVILGATGPTGEQLLFQCLAKGCAVVAFGRSPEKIKIQHENLTVVKGNVFSTEEMAAAFKGCSSVMSCLGNKGFGKTTFYEDSMKHIIQAMRLVGIKRLLTMTSWFVEPLPDDPFIIRYIIRPLVLSELLASMHRMECFLVDQCQDIEYTVVRPPGLSNGPVTTASIIAEVDKSYVTNSSSLSYMKRSDVARFMLDCLCSGSHIRQFVAINVKV